jgi:hypothetical protein
MDSENTIIPLYLYSNKENSFITDKKTDFSNMDFISVFYAISPNIKPTPSYTDLICVTNSNTTTIDISVLYDSLNFNTNCVRFLAWTERTPCTIPLYIRQNGYNIHISFDEDPVNNSYVPYKIPYIYVLPPANVKIPRCNGVFKKGKKYPRFKFSESFGKCIPDPESSLTIGECLVLHNKNITSPNMEGKQSTLLNFLENRYGNEKKTEYLKYILFFIFIIFCIFIFIFYKP